MVKTKILITGASGYVGYILAKFFSEKKIPVVGLDITENHAWKGNKNYKFYESNITNKNELKKIIAKESPTHIIHLAFLMDPLHNKKMQYNIDVNGSKYILEIANKTKSVKQFIQFSSASAYGAWPKNELWIGEDQELKPRDYRYGIHKKEIENYYNNYKKRKDLQMIILRMCTAIGPLYHKKGGIVSLLVKAPFLTKINNRFCELQLLHENDLTALMNLIINDKKIKGTFNLAPNSYATTKQLAQKKFFLPIPLWLLRGIIRTLWTLRLSSVRPAAITLSTYGIIISPKKLMKRYNYKFKHSTLSGFKNTVKKRKAKGTL